MGFTRRFSQFPSVDVLSEIEGVVTIDKAQGGEISGISQGVACLVGEFADVTFGVAIDANGAVTTKPQPTEIFGGTDLTDKCGGWDETIGEFGGDRGNGFIELKNKRFTRLIVVPINIASSHGARVWRKLPTNLSATVPSPSVPVQGATVPAGREFRSGSNRVRTAAKVQFSSLPEFKVGTDGSVTTLGSTAATQPFTTAGGGLLTVARPDGSIGVQVGDIMVLGVIGGASGLGTNADTYRIAAVDSATQLHLEKMDGTVFDLTTAGSLPWRIHTAECADSGGARAIASGPSFNIPMRPLDATIASSTLLTPTIIPPSITALSADPLSGLQIKTDPTTGLVYTPAIQAANAPSGAELDALYGLAIDSLLDDDLPEREVNILWSARASANIDVKGTSHVLVQKQSGIGRIWCYSPPLDVVSLATAVGDSTPGVGANRAREGIYDWPGVMTFAGEAVGFPVKGADGLTHKDGAMDVASSGVAAMILSSLAPERNPGQASDPVKTLMVPFTSIQRGVSGLGIDQYKVLKQKGVMAPRLDRTAGMIFQSGVTRSLVAGEKEIYTRRFSFYVEDSIAAALVPYTKEVLTEALKDRIVGAIHDFFDTLLSTVNSEASRIAAYSVDPKTGNTQELSDAGIYVVTYSCEMLPIANTIVQQASVGFGVLNINQIQG